MLGYLPCDTGFLTRSVSRIWDNVWWGVLTGAVASERVSEALKGSLRMVGNPFEECKGRRELDCESDGSSRYESRT